MKSGFSDSPGGRFRAALAEERPLQIVGAVNAFSAILAQEAGFKAVYLSGAGVANSSFGIPDVGATRLEDVVVDAGRIAGATSLPVLVDADTGWEEGGRVGETVRRLMGAGVAGIHLEDQVPAKKCGHLAHKALVTVEEMEARVRAAVEARGGSEFVIMARTDAVASEGLGRGIGRAVRYRDAGADMIFAEAVADLEGYREFVEGVGVPVLANITEFGRTPLFGLEELRRVGVRMVLYPLSAFRAMNTAASRVYHSIRTHGTQKHVVESMQTREELYQLLGYEPGAAVGVREGEV